MIEDRFKFRVWDAGRQKYWCDGILLSADGSIVTTACDDGCQLELDEGYVIEQCTGLKDCSGQLIYEGDILHKPDVIGGNHQVYFECGFLVDGTRLNVYLKETPSEFILVIGNVHEGVTKND